MSIRKPQILLAALLAVFVLPLSGCVWWRHPVPPAAPAPQSEAMVAAANPLAVEAGLEILSAGGSAADAAIATMAVLGLVEPQSAGLGGGALLLHYDARDKDLDAFDGRETAPAAATPELFFGEDGKPLPYPQAVASGRSVGAPGLVPALKLLHEAEGKLPWPRLFEPALRLAEAGFPISRRMHQSIAFMRQRGAFEGEAGASARAYLLTPEGAAKPVGEILRNPAYAETLRAIAAQGPKALQEGPIAEAIVASAATAPRPGGLTLADLAAYRAREVEPLCGPYRVYLVCSVPPPGSGGVSVPELLGLYARARPQPEGPASVEDWAAFIWASRLAYADRDYYLADTDFSPAPLAELVAPAYLDARARDIDLAKAAPVRLAPGATSLSGRWGTPPAQPEAGTTHLSVIDPAGNVVSMTATVEAPFGAQRMAAGFFLNNQLTDFSLTPTLGGKPVANAVAPGKRPRSSMSPTILLEADGDFYAAIGSPGGNSIIAYVAKAIIGVVDWDLSLQQAIELPNVVARGAAIRVERDGFDPAMMERLRALGWDIQPSAGENSGLHGFVRTPEGLEGGADPRREGQARRLD